MIPIDDERVGMTMAVARTHGPGEMGMVRIERRVRVLDFFGIVNRPQSGREQDCDACDDTEHG